MTVQTSRKLNNKGATVLEVIIMIAIIAVLISATFIGISVLNSSSISQGTRSTKSMLEKTRANAMSVSADEWYFSLKNEDGQCTAKMVKVVDSDNGVEEVKDEEPLGSKVTAKLLAGTIEADIDDGKELKITFEPASGSVKAVTLDGASYSPSDNMITIKLAAKSSTSDVKLYFLSGKVESN